ncbi:M20/M25/M40 family metallo-hydrolase [Proteocatella sphenisci]|uniref:M20/M25/M40 family metallo-hydrolase n=1 Tax=Proteocatella sphenisci TaxID=181070 RepID=UPI00048EDE81|nr:M20/M25/M40 family metallo-hydrolase [Proteocatella sphenisci]
MDLKQAIERNLLDYIATKTHTGTSLENNNVEFFTKWFQKVDYFKNHPENCGFYEIKGDHLGRKVPWALFKGQGEDTIVLIHHTDTVDTDDYGVNQELAYRPYDITEKYKEGNIDLDEHVKRDLDSGKWLFGRGVADMKGGAAIHLSLLEEYTKDKDFKGNLLLLGLPDEENLSAGMRGAVSLLDELKEKHNLNYILMLNVEPHERDTEEVATIYDGSVGKIMPVVYVRGKLAHVGQVFRGFNPINLLSAIVRKTELNPDFIQTVGNTTTPPPTWLYMKDQKQVYDVSLPIAAAGYMSILTLDKPPKEIFDKLYDLSYQAFEEVISDMKNSYKKYQEMSGKKLEDLTWKPNVKLYGDLYKEAVRDSGEDFTLAIEKLMEEVKLRFNKNELSIIDGAYMIIEKTLEFVKDLSPAVIIALAPPYYPNTNNDMVSEKCAKINKSVESLVKFAKKEWNQDYFVQNYFTGISDLSYAMFEADSENIGYIEENMLMWEDIYYIPLETIKKLSIPVLNIGPWGKDFHKYTERVYMEDLFNRTPVLIDRVIRQLLG